MLYKIMLIREYIVKILIKKPIAIITWKAKIKKMKMIKIIILKWKNKMKLMIRMIGKKRLLTLEMENNLKKMKKKMMMKIL